MNGDTPRPAITPATHPQRSVPPIKGEMFGKFKRTDRLGAGGMGEVWKAWDTELSRWVALKFLKGEDEEEIARFKREAVIAGKLSHANIGAIYEVGESQGRHYIAMQFVDGKTLRGWKGKPAEAAALLRDAARAVQSAHERDIVHRDIKPDNLMRDTAGRVFVMDFGLARPAEGASRLSISGMVVGTPSYMPPEQANGKRVDARADVYSLGATLYELLTGAAPFRGDTVLEVLRLVVEEDAVPPRRLRPDLDEPILAHPPSTFYRMRKKLAKRKALVVTLAIAFVAVTVAVGLLAPALLREREAKARAERVASLWSRVSVALSEAEQNARGGEMKRAIAKCDEGVAACAEGLDFAETHYFLARLHRVAGRKTEALAELERALTIDPAFGEARFERGLMRVEQYRALLLRLYQSGSSLIPAKGESAGRIAQRLETVVPALRSAREAAMADLSVKVGKSAFFRELDAQYGRAELEYLGGDEDRGLKLLREVVEADPLNVRAWTTLAMNAADDEKLQEALDLAEKAIDRHRGFGEAYFIRALVYGRALQSQKDEGVRKRYIEQGLKDANDAVAFGYLDAMVFAIRGQIRDEAGDPDGAIKDLDEALRRNPDFVKAWLMRAQAKVAKADHRGSWEDCDGALKVDAKNAQAYSIRADAKKALGDIPAAFSDATESARLNPKGYDAWEMRGECLRAMKRYEEAVEDLEKAALLKPKLAKPRALKAGVLQDLGRLDEAVAEGTRAIEAEGASYRGWLARGMANGPSGKLDDALRDLQEALKREPRLAAAWDGIGNCRAGKGDLDGAMKAYDESLKLDPKGTITLMNRATACVMKKDWAGAERDYSSLLVIDPENLAGLLRRADVRMRRGDKSGAAIDLEKLLRIAPATWPSRATAEAMMKKTKE